MAEADLLVASENLKQLQARRWPGAGTGPDMARHWPGSGDSEGHVVHRFGCRTAARAQAVVARSLPAPWLDLAYGRKSFTYSPLSLQILAVCQHRPHAPHARAMGSITPATSAPGLCDFAWRRCSRSRRRRAIATARVRACVARHARDKCVRDATASCSPRRGRRPHRMTAPLRVATPRLLRR